MRKITRETVRSLFRYDFLTGRLYWKVNKGQVKAGDLAGNFYTTQGGKTYGQVKINQRLYMLHRIIFLWVKGYLTDEIDHIDGDGTNNRIQNLRATDRKGNGRNIRRNTKNTSGVTGVSWDKKNQKWYSFIKVNRRLLNLGRYSDKNEAIKVRKAAELRYGFHENHGEVRPL